MKRMKTMALAVAITAMLTATVGAAGASASGFVAGSYPAELKAAPTATHYITTKSTSMQCEPFTFRSSMSGPSESISSGLTEGTCWQGIVSAPINMGSCNFTLKPGSGGTGTGTISIGPAGCGPITIKGPCQISIPAQTGLSATYSNTGSGTTAKVEISVNASGLVYTQGSGCASEGTYSDGSWKGTWALSATDLSGNSTSISVSSTLPNGLFLSGKESGEASQQPRLEAEHYPATFTSEIASAHVFTTNPGVVSCKSVGFSGTLSGSSNTFSATPAYGKCTTETPVVMNSCRYVLHVSNAGPPYVGTADVSCTSGGDAIEIRIPGCTVKIGAQSGLSGVTYTNEGTASSRKVKVSLNVTGISYNECGTARTNGSYSGVQKLGATF